VTDMLINKGLG